MERLLAHPQWQIDEEYEEDHLTGTIKTDRESQLIQTTLAFDKGWKIFVDGTEVETFETLDALVAFRINTAGEHTLEMRYCPDIYVLGWTLSGVGIGIFALLCATEFIIKKYRRKKMLFAYIPNRWVLEDEDIPPSLPEGETHSISKSNDSNGGT